MCSPCTLPDTALLVMCTAVPEETRGRQETSTVDVKTRDKSRGILNFWHNCTNLLIVRLHSTKATSGRLHSKRLATENYTEVREKSEILR